MLDYLICHRKEREKKAKTTYFHPESDARDCWPVISSGFLTSPEPIVTADTVGGRSQ